MNNCELLDRSITVIDRLMKDFRVLKVTPCSPDIPFLFLRVELSISLHFSVPSLSVSFILFLVTGSQHISRFQMNKYYQFNRFVEFIICVKIKSTMLKKVFIDVNSVESKQSIGQLVSFRQLLTKNQILVDLLFFDKS